MGKRNPNHRLVKIHRNYTVEEITHLFGNHKNTARRWVKEGLTPIDKKRPMLILGRDLAEFLKERRSKNKRPCRPGELYCVRCRAPKFPAGGMADYSPITEKTGTLIGICPDCETLMHRHVSLAKIGLISGEMDISYPEEVRQLIESTNPTVNDDLRKGI
jgi:hypothetical protein